MNKVVLLTKEQAKIARQKQAERDLEASLHDGELLARNQIAAAVCYLRDAQGFAPSQVKMLVNEVLTEQGWAN